MLVDALLAVTGGRVASRMVRRRAGVDEIRAAKLKANEEVDLEAALTVARSAEKLREGARAAYELLAGDRASARDRLALAERELRKTAELDPRLASTLEQVAAQVGESDDIAADLRRYAKGIDAEPGRLAELEARADL